MKNERMFSIIVLGLMLTASTMVFHGLSNANAVDSPRIYMNSSRNIYDETTPLGTKFNTTFWVENSPDMAAWQVYMEFNDTILNVTRWFEPKSDSPYIFYGKTTSANPSPPNAGYSHLGLGKARVEVAGNLFPTPPAQTPSSGKGELCIFEFNITAIPAEGVNMTSVLDINKAGYTYILNPDGDEVSGVTKENGYYEISKPALPPPPPPPPPPSGSRIFVDPPEIIDSTMIRNVSNFGINVSAENITDMKVCSFNFTYDSNIVGFIGIGLFKVNNQYPTVMLIMNDSGFVWIELTYLPSVTITTPPEPIVFFTFNLRNYGATPLNLTQVSLLDSSGKPIQNYDVQDGFFMTAIRDVAITDIALQRSWVYQGYIAKINVTAENLGSFLNETFDVKAYYNSTFLIGTVHVVDLVPNATFTAQFAFSTTELLPCHNYTISAEATQVPYENNITNNILVDGGLKVRWPGDVNGDGTVDIKDIYIVSQAYGSSQGSSKWNPIADINEDGIVDIKDIYIVSKNYGKGCLP